MHNTGLLVKQIKLGEQMQFDGDDLNALPVIRLPYYLIRVFDIMLIAFCLELQFLSCAWKLYAQQEWFAMGSLTNSTIDRCTSNM